MTFHVHRADKVRHLMIHASEGEVLPNGLLDVLRREGVASGWVRGSGVLADVSLRAYGSGAQGERLIAGRVQAITVEGSLGVVDGAPSFSLRAFLARETNSGVETVAGEIVNARTVSLDIFVTGFDDLAPGRKGWSAALEASTDGEPSPAPPRQTRTALQSPLMPMPSRPVRPEVDLDAIAPEAGDVVDHFAFGRCDVLKSDGDRLHLRIHKDGRVREIALEKLRVIGLSDENETPRRFKLERRL